ncbi:MAG TPA: cell wall hydrolase [Beijerinckiaceae bacterium]|nr:cell wall hydrolase [Beijerinckiaceae bacterium]
MWATAARWVLGAGLLVSFTASAGHDLSAGGSRAVLGGTLVVPDVLVPSSAASGLAELGLWHEARLRFDLPPQPPDEFPLPPRHALKPGAGDYPAVDRTLKGDPLVLLRPSLSRRAGEIRALLSPASRIVFGPGEAAYPPALLNPGPAPTGAIDHETGFVAAGGIDPTATRAARAEASPAARAGGGTAPGPVAGDGATPSVSRAAALSSTTPLPADAIPVEIAALPVTVPRAPEEPNVTARPKGPRYADLIDPAKLARERRCLAEAVYFEARSEPEEGQAAVAQVVLNRVKSGLYPSSICGVVYQNRHRYLACQFTFACEGKSLRITDSESWRTATRVASEVLEGRTYLAEVGGATHYHADYVRPRWAKRLKRMDVIGRHIFYKLRPGQT